MAESSAAVRLTGKQWLICGIAAMGFAFDIYELLMLPLIVRPALLALESVAPGSPEFRGWVQLLFYVPAVCGGIFGLLGGYLTDRFGRLRVLLWSILLYGFSAFAAGFATSAMMLLVLRCTTFIGVSVEFVAGIAWLAELFPEPKRRQAVLGYTQAFSSIGGLMVAGAYYVAVTYGDAFPAIYGGHEAWRYTLLSGLIPAIPLILIRPFLPESPVWQKKRAQGTLDRPSIAEIFQPAYRRTTIVTTIMMACTYAAAFGAIQQLPQMIPGLPSVVDLPVQQQQQAVAGVQSFQEFGGMLGRVLLAILAVRILGRRRLIRVFLIPGVIITPLVFLFPATNNIELLKVGIFLVGVLTVGQMSFWGNYLPLAYPTHLRGTGQSFAANVGGRMIGTFAAVVTLGLAGSMPGDTSFSQLAYAAAAVGFGAYAVSCVASFFLPDPGQKLPD